MHLNLCLILTLSIIIRTFCLVTKDITFVIITQNNTYSEKLGEKLKNYITSQSESDVYLTHKNFSKIEAWTIFPVLPTLHELKSEKTSWVIFLEDRTQLHLENLLKTLSKYDPEKELWLGHALVDKEATIIHHFAFFKDPTFFKYPNIASGFAISFPLFEKLSKQIRAKNVKKIDFNIDVSHEFALFVWQNGTGEMLQHDEFFCSKHDRLKKCATYPKKFEKCNDDTSHNSLYFGVKTYHEFHKDRVQVVKETWGKYARNIRFFSDVYDNTVPSIYLGIPNTEQGHCSKTLAILKYALEIDVVEFDWLVIVDDDTIISVSRLQNLLSCFNSEEHTAIGERYRFNGRSYQFANGYNYITGGGGMVFSKKLVRKLVETCKCPFANSPDDMVLGMCLAGLGVEIVHFPYFHQARPMDYPEGYLDTGDAISFHKHWMMDPIEVYREWFESSDASASGVEYEKLNAHEEL